MLAKSLILIVEDDPYFALDLTSTIEDMEGRVAGPTRDVAEALALLAAEPVTAAIIDWHLPGCSAAPVAIWLAERRVPFVIRADGHLPPPDRERHPDVPLLIKPLQPRTILARLIREIRRISRGPRSQIQKTAIA